MNAPARLGGRRKAYPTPAKIRMAVETARATGLDVAVVEVAPDGTIRVMEARAVPAEPTDLFDRLEAEGKLG